MKKLVILAVALFLAAVCTQASASAYGGGLPSAVWRGETRAGKRDMPKSEERTSRVKVRTEAGIPLSQAVGTERAHKVRNTVAAGQSINAYGGTLQTMSAPDGWRIKIKDAAVTAGPMVTLGEIAEPLGQIPAEEWQAMAFTQVWPAPEESGRPFQINKTRIIQGLRAALGEQIADRCIIPTSLTLQKGGMVLREDDLRSYIVRTLTPQLAALPGEAVLQDLRLPAYIFLAHPQQIVELEPVKLAPGRINLRFVLREADGQVLKRIAGSAFLDMWISAPAAARPLNKGDQLSPENITFIRMNAANLRDMPWDGRGGPWQVLRPIGAGQPIFQGDLAAQAMVRKGTVVTIHYSAGNVQIRVQGEAMSDGEPGATIPVRNLQSKKQIYATVLDGNTVVVK